MRRGQRYGRFIRKVEKVKTKMRSKKEIQHEAERLLYVLENAEDVEKARKAMTWRKAMSWMLGEHSIELELLLRNVAAQD